MPGAAPANPTGLNFQSDPSMRAQFKGFMSGMSAKQPAPMMQQPLPMPAPMQNIDIFQPMPMAMGGAVPRSTQIAGQPHMLSYITPGEANVLQAMGGSGRPGPGGIPAFDYYSEAQGGFSGGYSDPFESPGTAGTSNFSSSSSNFSSDESDSGSGATTGLNLTRGDGTPGGVGIKGTTITGGTILGQDDPAMAGFDFFGSGSGSSNDPTMDALNRAIANTNAVNQAEALRELAIQDPALAERFQDIQAADTVNRARTGVADFLGEYGTGAGLGAAGPVSSLRDTMDAAIRDSISPNNLLDTVFDSDDYDRPVDTVFDVDTTFTGPIGVPPEVQSVRGLEGQAMGPFDLANRATPEGIIEDPVSSPTSRPEGLGPSSLSSIAIEEANPAAFGRGGRQAPELDFDLGGMGAEGESVPTGPTAEEVQQAIDMARATGESALTKQSEIGRLADLMNRQTTVTLTESLFDKNKKDAGNVTNIPGQVDPNTGLPATEGAKSVSSLEQLGRRAGRGSQGIAGFMEKLTGFNPAASMYEDITQNNYAPIYDSRGQIIGTVNPETGQLGKGSRPIGMGAISPIDGDLEAYTYNQFQDMQDQVSGDDINTIIRTINQSKPEEEADDESTGIGGVGEDPTTPPSVFQPSTSGEAAKVGMPLQFGYGQLSGLTPNLNSAADDFLKLLSGGR